MGTREQSKAILAKLKQPPAKAGFTGVTGITKSSDFAKQSGRQLEDRTTQERQLGLNRRKGYKGD